MGESFMTRDFISALRHGGVLWLAAWAAFALAGQAAAQGLVPGTGLPVPNVGDDFEDPAWSYNFNLPKGSAEEDKQERHPIGESANDRWYEGIKRGQPDVIRRVPTPEGGLEGSTGSLLIRSVYTGIPNRPSYSMKQDDLIANVHYRLGGSIPVSQYPSFVTRVYFPPLEQWEKRSGPTFAIRAAVDTTLRKRGGATRETYWPGMFVHLDSKADGAREDAIHLTIRAGSNGGDFDGPRITQTGWWTFGMSFTPDGAIHYYAKPGVEDLTAKDRISSQFAYGYRCERFKTFFFNVCSADDGRTWSTPWIIDDSFVYFVPPKSDQPQASNSQGTTR
jgi:hypothetical protein